MTEEVNTNGGFFKWFSLETDPLSISKTRQSQLPPLYTASILFERQVIVGHNVITLTITVIQCNPLKLYRILSCAGVILVMPFSWCEQIIASSMQCIIGRGCTLRRATVGGLLSTVLLVAHAEMHVIASTLEIERVRFSGWRACRRLAECTGQQICMRGAGTQRSIRTPSRDRTFPPGHLPLIRVQSYGIAV